MRTRPRLRTILPIAALAAVLSTAACGESGSSGTGGDDAASGSSASGDACAPVAGDQLVRLEDDKKLQTVDNIIPAVSAQAAAADPDLITTLDTVSAVLTTADLTDLIDQVDNQRESAVDVAAAYVEEQGLADGVSGGSGPVAVGGANFTESQVLANVYAEVLNAAGYTATVQSVGNREAYLPALQRNEIQAFPEYVGTLTEFLDGDDAKAVASSDLDATVQALTGLAQANQLVVGEPAEAADQNAFAITEALSEQLGGITTLSELAEACSDGSLVLGAVSECPTRPFCQPGLEETYGLEFASVEDLDLGGPTNQALEQGVVSIGLVLSTDPALAN
ncbi:glycine/betaine ABC transporter substrate-binding protein [Modestobacter versicolor]|uniref:Glycine/betaine ABC transporter substrate-binding protein n=1 Tax=Modestobacter versicolor TaxID=429133 RepID=A0A323V821_9ACTN|nr:glycine betaine ABC transporter substrate-binding protein [Modestobacter versicolor]PZA20200.1 glycine/betaine ABC transporter substrate-binding protein [Modestobacter versicolor]